MRDSGTPRAPELDEKDELANVLEEKQNAI
jgi:hypothetical protein